MLVMGGVGFTKSSLVNEAFAVAAPGNTTNATKAPNPQAVIQKGGTAPASSSSSSNDVKTTTTNNNITLGNPFYIQYDKITNQVPVPLRSGGTATGVIFSGNGTVKGIGFTDAGRALIIPISKTIVDIDGGLVIKANDGGKDNGNATLSFREISNMTSPGTMQGSGAAIFNPNATGKLSFLSNTVAMFTGNGNKDGTNIVKAWEWKYK
jgi:hypothetical protein